MTVDVSILVPSWNTQDLTLACLDALPQAAAGVRHETIVVDNGSRDGSAEALARRDDIRLVTNRENEGYAAAINAAYEHATGDFVLLLNSDVRVAPGALRVLVDFLVDRETAAGVAPRFLNPDGSLQHHCYRLPTLAIAIGLATSLRRLPVLARRLRAYRMLDADFSRSCTVPLPSASCLLLRRAALRPDALLDTAYPIYFNDVELARALAAGGWTLWVTPDARAHHELGASTRNLGSARTRHHLASLTRDLASSSPRRDVLVFRSVVAATWIVQRLLRRPDALSQRELRRALRGDPGLLPSTTSPAQ